MTKITYRLVEMKTKYWCHKSEALKAIAIKTITYISIVALDFFFTLYHNTKCKGITKKQNDN